MFAAVFVAKRSLLKQFNLQIGMSYFFSPYGMFIFIFTFIDQQQKLLAFANECTFKISYQLCKQNDILLENCTIICIICKRRERRRKKKCFNNFTSFYIIRFFFFCTVTVCDFLFEDILHYKKIFYPNIHFIFLVTLEKKKRNINLMYKNNQYII